MKFLAVCIANRYKPFEYDEVPYYCYVHEPAYFPRVATGERGKEEVARQRIEQLPKWWNEAHRLALEFYPSATHFLDVGSYYLDQLTALRRLVWRYENLDSRELILAGNIWSKGVGDDLLGKRYQTYDGWGFPDLAGLSYHFFQPRGLAQVSAVANPMIYPIEYSQKHPFHASTTNPNELWYTAFCRETKAPVFIDFDVRFYRNRTNSGAAIYSFRKRARIWAGKRLRRYGFKREH